MRQRFGGRGLTLALGVILAACAESSDAPVLQGTGTGELPPGHPEVGGAPAQMPGADGPVGVVLETMDSGGYTYALLDVEGDQIWSAGPVTAINVGDSVTLAGAMGMEDFHSSTLDRTFDQILFLGAFQAPMGGSGVFTGNRGLVTETMNAAGYTYALVEIAGESMWLAGPEAQVAVGDTVGWMDGTLMRQFSSATLDRTWDVILFVDRFVVMD